VRGNEADGFIHDRRGGFCAKGEIRLVPTRAVGVDRAGFIETVVGWRRRAFTIAEMPFAKMRRGITGFLKQRGDVRHIWVQPVVHAPCSILRVRGIVAVDFVSRRILPGHKGAATRRTNGAVDVKLREEGAFLCQPVEVRRFDLRMTIAAEITPTKVVGEDENEVGLAGRISRRQSATGDQEK
jgi:hypothetical protein